MDRQASENEMATLTPPAYRLYSPASVSIASIIGSPIAGGHLMARNFRRAGRPDLARRVFLICAIGFVLVVVGVNLAAAAMKFSIANDFSVAVAISGGLAAALGGVANVVQGATLREHRAAGGKLDRGGAGIALMWGALLAGVYFGLNALVPNSAGPAATEQMPSEIISENGGTLDIRFEGITPAQARDFGHRLALAGYTGPGTAAQVFITRSSGVIVATFPVQDGTWGRQGIADAFGGMVRSAAPAIGARPIRVRLVDVNLNEKLVFMVE